MREDRKRVFDMPEQYKTIYKPGNGEITEKKSRFIGMCQKAESEEEALAFIEQIKKTYWDARHHCYAYVIGKQGEIQRMSDDGEPAKTAGKPILDVLSGEGLVDTVIVVTRYFGGTLLGTGGLVRAYTGGAKAALASSSIITRIPGHKLMIAADYTDHGKIQYLLLQRGIYIMDTVYTEKVELHVIVPNALKEIAVKEITEGTGGRAKLTFYEECYFAETENGTEIF